MHIVIVVNYGIWNGMYKARTRMDNIAVFSTWEKATNFVKSVENIEYEMTKVIVDNEELYTYEIEVIRD